MKPDQPSFLLAHLSDPHLPLTPGVTPRDFLGKRTLSYLSWHLNRRHRHRRETLDALTADLAQQGPDHIAVTGDLTNLGLETEYLQAHAWLDDLGEPENVSVIPGNHEAMVKGAWERGGAHWRPFWQGDSPARNQAHAFPYLRVRGQVALMGLSTAIASRPGLAVGALGEAQLARLAPLLARARDAGLCRVLMIHHPPLAGTVPARKALLDAPALQGVLAREGAELLLHGHSHRSHLQEIDTADGAAPVIGVPSASSMHHEPAAYNLYRIATRPEGWALSVKTRRLSAARQIEALQGFETVIARSHAGGNAP